MSEVEISTDEGTVTLREFSVGNAAESQTSGAFKLGEVAVTLDVGLVTENTVHIGETLIAEPEVI